MAKKNTFDATAFDFGANAKPKKPKRFGQRRSPSGKIYFSGGSSGGGKKRKSNRFSAAGGS